MATKPTIPFPAGPELTGKICAICQTGFEAGEPSVNCPSCAAPFHQECWEENGGCASYGCESMPETVAKENAEAFAPQAYWGKETKTCPACNKEIKVAAKRCRFCGETFSTTDPQDPKAFLSSKSDSRGKSGNAVVVFFVLSLIPCLSPLVLMVGWIWYASGRDSILKLPRRHRALWLTGMIASGVVTAVFALILILMSFSS